MRFTLLIAAFIALGSGMLAGCNNAAAPKPGEATKANAVNTANTPGNANVAKNVDHDHVDDAPRITLADAKKDFDGGKTVFIDTRDDVSFKQEHVKGAINVPLNKINELFGAIPKGKKIVVYCSWPNEHSSAGLVAELKKRGINDAFALVGGTAAWKTAGYPMEGSK